MVSSRVVRIAGLVIGAAALVFALLPFTVTVGGRATTGDTVACRAPVVDAVSNPPRDRGWFGYAPLTALPTQTGYACREPARHRLVVSAAGMLVAALLGWWSARVDGDTDLLRRRRWRPRPA